MSCCKTQVLQALGLADSGIVNAKSSEPFPKQAWPTSGGYHVHGRLNPKGPATRPRDALTHSEQAEGA